MAMTDVQTAETLDSRVKGEPSGDISWRQALGDHILIQMHCVSLGSTAGPAAGPGMWVVSGETSENHRGSSLVFLGLGQPLERRGKQS